MKLQNPAEEFQDLTLDESEESSNSDMLTSKGTNIKELTPAMSNAHRHATCGPAASEDHHQIT